MFAPVRTAGNATYGNRDGGYLSVGSHCLLGSAVRHTSRNSLPRRQLSKDSRFCSKKRKAPVLLESAIVQSYFHCPKRRSAILPKERHAIVE